jgi:hypothetical protein
MNNSLREAVWMIRRSRDSVRKTGGQLRADAGAWRRFWKSFHAYLELGPRDEVLLRSLYPCLGDDTAETEIEPTYFYQDAWAFEKIVQNLPTEHVDVGSHHKFVALLSKVVPVTMVDIRPLSLPLETLTFRQGSILEMPYADRSVQSLSSMCVVEHIGLGRYGDPLDPEGTEKAMAELKRIIAPGGSLYLSVPIDDVNRTYFNAHRAFTESYLEDLFHPLEIVERRYIYGREFGSTRRSGFGTGCYHLKLGSET